MVPPAVLLMVPTSSSSPLFMVPKLSMVPSALLVMVPKLSMMPPLVFDIVMLPELEKVLSLNMPTPDMLELDIVMVPELEKVSEMRVPSPAVFDIVMVPVAVLLMLELVPALRPMEVVPEFDTVMLPELVRMLTLAMPLPQEFDIVMLPEFGTAVLQGYGHLHQTGVMTYCQQVLIISSLAEML